MKAHKLLRFLIFLTGAGTVSLSGSANATPVLIEWSGSVSSVNSNNTTALDSIGTPTTGQAITGTFHYDTDDLIPDQNSSPDSRDYSGPSFITSSFTVGGVTTVNTVADADTLQFSGPSTSGGNQTTSMSIIDDVHIYTVTEPTPPPYITIREFELLQSDMTLVDSTTGLDFNQTPFNWEWSSDSAGPASSYFQLLDRFVTQTFEGRGDSQTLTTVDDLRYDIIVNLDSVISAFAVPDTGSGTVIPAGQTGSISAGDTFNNTLPYLIEGTLTNDGGFVNDGGLVTVASGGLMDGSGSFRQDAGSLVVNGVIDLAQDIEILGGTLSGEGIINGTVMLGDGSEFAPGNSPGTLTIEGDLIIDPGALIQIEFGDIIEVLGDLFLPTGSMIELVFGAVTLPSEISLNNFFNVTGAIGGGLPDISIFTDTGDGTESVIVNVFQTSTSAVVRNSSEASPVDILSVPEPGTLALLVIGIAGVGFSRCRLR